MITELTKEYTVPASEGVAGAAAEQVVELAMLIKTLTHRLETSCFVQGVDTMSDCFVSCQPSRTGKKEKK